MNTLGRVLLATVFTISWLALAAVTFAIVGFVFGVGR